MKKFKRRIKAEYTLDAKEQIRLFRRLLGSGSIAYMHLGYARDDVMFGIVCYAIADEDYPETGMKAGDANILFEKSQNVDERLDSKHARTMMQYLDAIPDKMHRQLKAPITGAKLEHVARQMHRTLTKIVQGKLIYRGLAWK